jgi:hypothetical protein
VSEDIGEYEVQLRVKGKREFAHYFVKDIENGCSLAETYLGLEIEKKVVLKK